MPDWSIPAHAAGRPAPITYGRFIRVDDTVVLVDRRGNRYSLDYVNIIAGFWGRSEDGVVKLPRPWVYVPGTDEVLIEGDIVLILFMDGNYQRPMVLGAARAFGENTAGLPYAYDADDDALANKLRARLRNLDDTLGDNAPVLAEVRWSIHDTPGVARVEATGHVETKKVIPVVPPEAVLRSEAYLADFQASLTEIIAAFGALGVSLPSTTALAANVATSIAVGAPYRSTTLKAE